MKRQNKINNLLSYIFVCLIIFSNIAFAKSINLTQEEKKFITNSTINVGVEQWSPIIFSDNGSDIDGICGDFTKTNSRENWS